jgi:hypothetical protein
MNHGEDRGKHVSWRTASEGGPYKIDPQKTARHGRREKQIPRFARDDKLGVGGPDNSRSKNTAKLVHKNTAGRFAACSAVRYH